MKSLLKALSALLLAALLGWAAAKVPWAATWATLWRFPPGTLLALLALNLVILWLFALRWWWLLRLAGHPVAWGRLTAYRLAAFSVSYFTPGSQFGGEPLQVFALYRDAGVPAAQATATVALDKLLELVSNFGFLLVGALALARLELLDASARLGLLFGAASIALLAGGYLLSVCRGTALLTRFTSRLPWLSRLARGIAQTEAAARQICRARTVLLKGVLLVAPVWVALVAEYALMTHGMGMPLSLTQILVLMTAARLAFLLPLLPGGLGTLEAGLVLAVGVLGYGPSHGLALALLIRLRDLTVGAVGLILAHRLGMQTLDTRAPLSSKTKNTSWRLP